MGPGRPVKVSAHQLLRELQELPAQPSVAMRVVLTANDERSALSELGRLIELDPALTAHVMRLANSAYYGLNTPVSSATRAVTIVGLATARAVATSVAMGLEGPGVPPGFWEHSAATASAAAVVAPRVGCNRADAFSLGLLHDLGAALLHRVDPQAYAEVTGLVAAGEQSLVIAEIEAFGTSHDQAAAGVLEAWNFPPPFVAAVRSHHDRGRNLVNPMTRVLASAEEISLRLPNAPIHEVVASRAMPSNLAEDGLGDGALERLLDQVAGEAAALVDSLLSLPA